MAHHLAERLTALDHVAPNHRKQAEDEVADLILRIWEHGRQEGFFHDPVRLSTSVARAVAKLDPAPDDLYYQTFGFVPRLENANTEVDKHLQLAVLLDREVGHLMRSLVVYAATVAEDQEEEWIRLLRKVEQDPLWLIRDLGTFAGHMDGNDPQEMRAETARRASKVRALLTPLADEAPPQPTSRSRRLRLVED